MGFKFKIYRTYPDVDAAVLQGRALLPNAPVFARAHVENIIQKLISLKAVLVNHGKVPVDKAQELDAGLYIVKAFDGQDDLVYEELEKFFQVVHELSARYIPW